MVLASMTKKKKKVRRVVPVGWMPWCIGQEDINYAGIIGPWPAWSRKTRAEVVIDVRENAVGFRFKIGPIYAEVIEP